MFGDRRHDPRRLVRLGAVVAALVVVLGTVGTGAGVGARAGGGSIGTDGDADRGVTHQRVSDRSPVSVAQAGPSTGFALVGGSVTGASISAAVADGGSNDTETGTQSSDATANSVGGSGSDVEVGTTWRQFQRDAHNSGYTEWPAGPSEGVTEQWRFDAGGVVRSSPVVAGGTVYFGADRTVYALDTETGEKEWSASVAGSVNTPAVVGGTVYVTAGKFVYAFDAETGSRKWKTGEITERGIGGAPTVSDGTVYVPASNVADKPQVYALNATDGSIEWSSKLKTGVRPDARVTYTLAVDNGRVYMAGLSGKDGFTSIPVLFTLDAETGERIWDAPGEDKRIRATPSAAVTVSGDGAHVYSSPGPPGVTVWETDAGSGSTRALAVDENPPSNLAGPITSLAAAEGKVYIGTGPKIAVLAPDEDNDRQVYAYDPASETTEWTYTTDGPVIAAPAVAGDVVYVGTSPGLGSGTVVALNRSNGNLLWEYDVGGPIWTTPAVANGTVFVGSDDGHLYALSRGGDAPDPDFTTEPADPETGSPVTFNASLSRDGTEAGDIVRYRWEFPDGSTATGPTANYTFDDPWVYDVTLTVTDDEGVTVSTTRDVTVTPPVEELTANFTYEPFSPAAGDEITFDASTSSGEVNITDYNWIFPNSPPATGRQVTHTFSQQGTYNVTLSVTDEVGKTDNVTRTIQVGSSRPIPNISVSPERPDVGETVTLDASGSTDPDSGIASYEWTLGDGTVASGETITHAFDETGTYLVTLTVTDDTGVSNSTTAVVTVGAPPEAKVSVTPESPAAGDTVTFDASASTDPDGSIASYEWDFGDGTDATGSSAAHAFGSAGTYTVELTVTDNGGLTDTTTVTVPVDPSAGDPKIPPDADFEVWSPDPTAGEPIVFDGSGTSDPDGSVRSYNWSFGDGTNATGRDVSHTYNRSGNYTVTLNVTDDDGETAVTTRRIRVETGTNATGAGNESGPFRTVYTDDFEGTDPLSNYTVVTGPSSAWDVQPRIKNDSLHVSAANVSGNPRLDLKADRAELGSAVRLEFDFEVSTADFNKNARAIIETPNETYSIKVAVEGDKLILFDGTGTVESTFATLPNDATYHVNWTLHNGTSTVTVRKTGGSVQAQLQYNHTSTVTPTTVGLGLGSNAKKAGETWFDDLRVATAGNATASAFNATVVGYYGTYYNLPESHPDMAMTSPSRTGLVRETLPLRTNSDGEQAYDQFDWYDSQYRAFSRTDERLDWPRNFFPINNTKPGDPYHFAVHWEATVTAPENGTYNFTVRSDDDSWVFVDGELAVDNGGAHAIQTNATETFLSKGTHSLDVFFAERHRTGSRLVFEPDDRLAVRPSNGTSGGSGSDLPKVARSYDDGDGDLTITELGTAAAAYATGDISITELGRVAAAYATS